MKVAIEAEPRAKPLSILVVACGLTTFDYTCPDSVMAVPITALREWRKNGARLRSDLAGVPS